MLIAPLDRAAEAQALEVPAVERRVVFDMIRRSLPGLPVLVLVAGLVWGWNGAFSAAFAITLVVLNFILSATLLGWAARVSLALLMFTALFGFLVRLCLVSGVVFLVKDQDWVELLPLCLTLLVAHLGLLVWETRHVSASLAFPDIAPKRAG